jgi:diaminopimelate epimerase
MAAARLPHRLPLVKAQALGNDFLLVPASAAAGLDGAMLARLACDRHHAVGADGLIIVSETAAGAGTRLFNADGSPSEVSGNGVRCVAAWLAHSRRVGPGTTLTIDTGAGPKALTLLDVADGRYVFRAAMGQPDGLRQERLEAAGELVTAVILRVGNPQCVVLGPATDERLRTIGAALAVHPAFPEGSNVELAQVERPDRVRILIWERGVGPTEASGTGACAAAVAAAAYGGAGRLVEVVAPGGTQRVEWSSDGVWLTGWAALVGTIDWWPTAQ